MFRTSRATLARLPLYYFYGVRANHECLAFCNDSRILTNAPPLMNHSALAIPISARSTGFCVIWVYISSSSTSPAACDEATATARQRGRLARDWESFQNPEPAH